MSLYTTLLATCAKLCRTQQTYTVLPNALLSAANLYLSSTVLPNAAKLRRTAVKWLRYRMKLCRRGNYEPRLCEKRGRQKRKHKS